MAALKEMCIRDRYQGKVAMMFDAGSNAGEYTKNSEFEVGILPFPYVAEGGKYALNTVTNALFIPANAKHPEEAVRFMKYYTSDAGIEEIIKSGRLPATISMQDKVCLLYTSWHESGISG